MSQRSTDLVGRQFELAVMEEVLDTVGCGSPWVLTIAGEPGIGKSRLLAELTARAAGRGHLVLSGRGTELERDLPFGVVRDALDDHLASLGSEELGALTSTSGVLQDLTGVFPSLTSRRDGPPLRLQQERYEIYRAVRTLLDALAAERPLVLALDDLHWADPASVELVSHLTRHPPQRGVLLVAAFRPAQVAPELEAVLQAACRQGGADRLDLAPLTLDQAAEVAGGGMAREVCEALWLESGGNPFYLQELLSTGGRPSPHDCGVVVPGDIPPAVRLALAEEIGALSPPARALLEASAVAGDPFDLDLSRALAGVDEAAALAALDELLRFDLLRGTAVPRRFRFRHPIVRRTAYESTPAGRRIGAHSRAAALLAEWGAPASVRAHHVERSASRGDEQAVTDLAQAAGEAATGGAPATAARWYQAALRLLPEGPAHAHGRLALLVPLAGALCAAGRLDEGRGAVLGAMDLAGPEHADLRTRLVASCASIEHLLSRHEEAQARLSEALGSLPEGSPAAPALVKELGVGAMYANEFEWAGQWAAQAHQAARRGGDTALVATSAAMAAYAEAWQGHGSRAAPYLEEAQELVDGLRGAEAAAGPEASFWLGFAAHFMDHLDDATRHFERGIGISRATGQGQFLLPLVMGLELSLIQRGRLADAAEEAEAALEGARLAGNDMYLVGALWERCLLATSTGDLDTAMLLGQQALELANRIGEKTLHAAASWALAAALFEAGHLERSRALLLDGLGGAGLPRMATGGRCRSYELLTAIELGLGHAQTASGWARRAKAAASGTDLPLAHSAALRANALVLLASGDAGGAAEQALAAAELASCAGAAVEAARSRLLTGRALSAAGERRRSLALLEQAEAELAGCGAEGYRQQAARELRRLGRRAPSREREAGGAGGSGGHGDLAALSPRELDVARLVAAGHTNRQLADSLYLSVKTVERHLAHIFAKLGVSSRAGVAALVAATEAMGSGPQPANPRPVTGHTSARVPKPPWLQPQTAIQVPVWSAAAAMPTLRRSAVAGR